MSNKIKKRYNPALGKVLLGGTLLVAMLKGKVCLSSVARYLSDLNDK